LRAAHTLGGAFFRVIRVDSSALRAALASQPLPPRPLSSRTSSSASVARALAAVIDQPPRRARASGSISRHAPQSVGGYNAARPQTDHMKGASTSATSPTTKGVMSTVARQASALSGGSAESRMG